MSAKLLQPPRSGTRRARAALRALFALQPEVYVVAVIVVGHDGDPGLTVALDSCAPISKESTMLPPNVTELRRGSAHTAQRPAPAPAPERGIGLRLVRPMAPTVPTA